MIFICLATLFVAVCGKADPQFFGYPAPVMSYYPPFLQRGPHHGIQEVGGRFQLVNPITLTINVTTTTLTTTATAATTCTTSTAALSPCTTAGRRRRGLFYDEGKNHVRRGLLYSEDSETDSSKGNPDTVPSDETVVESSRKARQFAGFMPVPSIQSTMMGPFYADANLMTAGGHQMNAVGKIEGIFVLLGTSTVISVSSTSTTVTLTATCLSTTSYSTCSPQPGK